MHEICFIDDTIPVASAETINDADRLNRSNLRLLLNERASWPEAEVRDLVNALLADESSWNVSAFIHPDIYLNSVENESYRPDIIIYDWEYAGGTADSSTILLEILKATYAVVYIYSGADHKTQIDQALEHTDLRFFKDRRLFLLMKDEEKSHEKLLKEAGDFYKRNFSFRFGARLRTATIKALDKVLVDLGAHEIDFVTRLLADGETEETDIKRFVIEKVRHHLLEAKSLYEMLKSQDGIEEPSVRELLGVFITKLTAKINSIQLDLNLPPGTSSTDGDERQVSKQLWSQRIYYQPSDSVVRRGDIVHEKEAERYYLVITADCDLNRFWHKNYGFINLVPLYDCSCAAEDIKRKLLLTKNESQLIRALRGSKIQSLTGNVNGLSEGPFICPFLNIDGEIHMFIGFPKEIVSIEVEAPAVTGSPGERKNIHLSYKHLSKFKRVTTVSEPFVTALVQHCISAISGYGTPDFPNAIKEALPEEVLQLLFKIEPGAGE